MAKKILFPVELTDQNRSRRDYLLREFGNYMDIPKSSILEVGIGNGRWGNLLGNSFKQYFGVDPDKEYVRLARRNIPPGANINYQIGDDHTIPFDEKMDIVFYANSWHFIRDFDVALKEAKRVLKPKGIIAILDPLPQHGNWASPKLRIDNLEYDKELFEKKMMELRMGREAIFSQDSFNIDRKDTINSSQFYVLTQK